MDLFLVQGCGVSLICEKGQGMLDWIAYIIQRGGVPEIKAMDPDAARSDEG